MKKILNNYFKLEENGTTISKEIMGGLITFLAMSYIIFVNPQILSSTDADFASLFTATALTAGISTLIMGLLGNKPFGIASSMSLNSFFAITICQIYGFSFNEALSISFISAILYLVLTITGFRELIIKSLPTFLKKAIGTGIGLFIALVGFINAGLIVKNDSTLISLGNLANPSVWIALFGLLLIIVLTALKVKGSIIITLLGTLLFGIILTLCNLETGIVFNGIFSIPAKPNFTGFIDGFKTLSLDKSLEIFISLFAILFLLIFNAAGNISATEDTLNLKDKKALKKVLIADSLCVFVSTGLGTSPASSFGETMTGIESGARTGLANLITALGFFLALFLSPLISIVTSEMTAAILIMVGVTMMGQTIDIDWKNPVEAIPAFFTIWLMPLTYSITNGIAFGVISYVILKAITFRKKDDNSFFKDLNPMLLILAIIFIIYFFIS